MAEKQYTVRTVDGKMLGPLPYHHVIRMLHALKITSQDNVAYVGESFRPLSTYPEFSVFFKNSQASKQQSEAESEEFDDSEPSELFFEGVGPVRTFSEKAKPDLSNAKYCGWLRDLPFSRLLFLLSEGLYTGCLRIFDVQHKEKVFFFVNGKNPVSCWPCIAKGSGAFTFKRWDLHDRTDLTRAEFAH